MRIIFVRHGEPDYSVDGLTEKGKLEAEALAERTIHWEVDRFYCSPLGRARMTAEPTLRALNREAVIYPWLQEFSFSITDPLTGGVHGLWDLMQEGLYSDPMIFDKDNWFKCELYRDIPGVEQRWHEVCDGLDGILKEYGYTRKGSYYEFANPNGSVLPAEPKDLLLHGVQNYEVRDDDDDKTIVIFCHFGVTSVMLAHLMNVSPAVLWHGTCIPPTGVTVVNAEKRLHNTAHFRTQSLGDCAHLLAKGMKVSGYAAFSTVFSD